MTVAGQCHADDADGTFDGLGIFDCPLGGVLLDRLGRVGSAGWMGHGGSDAWRIHASERSRFPPLRRPLPGSPPLLGRPVRQAIRNATAGTVAVPSGL